MSVESRRRVVQIAGVRLPLTVVFGLLVATPAAAEAPSWAVLPVRSERPPPRDPTLLRLTKQVGNAIVASVPGKVRVVNRDIRDEACPSDDGICGREVALHLSADRAISLYLMPGNKSLKVRIYGARTGLEKEGTVPCKWSAGLVKCNTKNLKPLLQVSPKDAPEKASATVEARFKRLEKRLKRCTKRGWGEWSDRPEEAMVQFSVGARGQARDVRLIPQGIRNAPAFSCMARVVESLKLPKTAASTRAHRFPLPLP